MYFSGDATTEYIFLEGNLFAVIKGKTSNIDDLFIQTEYVLDDINLGTLTFERIADTMYKVVFTDKFKYLTGQIDNLPRSSDYFTQEINSLRTTEHPLTNYLNTL